MIWEATRPPYITVGGYYPTDISFEDANAMMAENLLFKKRYRKHYAVTPPLSINTQQKEPISLIMEMRSYEASRAGADIMADNHIDFKYSVTYRISWGPCVLIMGLVLSVGFVLQENRRIYKKQIPSCQVLEEMAKTALLKFSNKCRITFNG
jgi:urocanate hydratase